MRPHVAVTGDVPPGELGDHQRAGAGVDTECPVEQFGRDFRSRAAGRIAAAGRERVTRRPTGRVVDHDVDRAELGFGPVEQHRRCRDIEQVGLDRDGPPAGNGDSSDDLVARSHAVLLVTLRRRRVLGDPAAKVGDHDGDAVGREPFCRRCADAVIGSGDDRDVLHRKAIRSCGR